MESLAKQLDAMLAPYAVKNVGGLGRIYPHTDKPGDQRTRFEIDEGRILHSMAFRGLEKTQVYPHEANDSYTPATRWSHSAEVAYFSKCHARALGVNSELAYVLGLGHDLGHTPFGHEGEEAMKTWMKKHGLGFEHNEQTVRLLTILSYHSDAYRGLNLNVETIDGFRLHSTKFDHTQSCERGPSLEAQIASAADTISWVARDIHDGVKMGILDAEKLRSLRIFNEAERATLQHRTEVRSAIISLLGSDILEASRSLLRDAHPKSIDDIYTSKHPLIDFSETMNSELDALIQYLLVQMYRPSGKQPFIDAVRTVIHALCDHYMAHPTGDVLHLERISREHNEDMPRVIAVKDYVASFTDRQAGWHALQDAKIDRETLERTSAIFRA